MTFAYRSSEKTVDMINLAIAIQYIISYMNLLDQEFTIMTTFH